MKNIYLHIALYLVIFLSGNVGYSQSAYFDSKIYKDAISIPGNITYHVKLNFIDINVPVVYKTIHTNTSQTFFGDSIPDIADDNSGSSLHQFVSYALNASNLLDTLGSVCYIPKGTNFFYNYLIPNTPGLCNGGLSFTIDTIAGKYLPGTLFNIGLITMPANTNTTYSLKFGLNVLDTLCDGIYQFATANFSYNGNIGESHTFRKGPTYMATTSTMSVSVNPFADDSGTNCVGKARVSVSGGSAPYLYSFDNISGFTATDSITGLCAGVHTVFISDTQDTIARNFIINNSASTINNPNPYNGPVIDTLILNHADCSFDFTIPVDSASLSNYSISSLNVLYITVQVWQAGNVTVITDSINYPFSPNSCYMLGINIYCGSPKAFNVTSFNGIRVNDYVFFNNTVTNIINNKSSQLSVYPNPFKDELGGTINSRLTITNIELKNVIGQKIELDFKINNNVFTASTENIHEGIYFITITTENAQKYTLKIIKQN
jgi:hypothetical protein